MNLIESFNADRMEVQEELQDITEDLLADAFEAVERRGRCSPVVVAITGPTTHTYLPEWHSPSTQDQAFDDINANLADLNANAVTLVFSADIIRRDTGQETQGVLALMLTHDWQKMLTYPYTLSPSGASISPDPIIDEEIIPGLVELPPMT